MKKFLSAMGVGAAALLALTGCGAADAAAPSSTPVAIEVADLDSLVKAAQAEGTVRVYSQLTEPDMERFVQAFRDKYGIQVESLRLGGNTLGSRFDAETQAGTPSGEVLIVVDVEFMKTAIDNGDVVGFSEAGIGGLLDGLPEEAVFADYDAPMLQVVDVGFIYNTDRVDEADLPKSWSQLVGTEWKGRYCSVDPSTTASTAHFFWNLLETEGEELVADFGANIGRWYPNIVALNEAVSVGECDLGVSTAKFMVDAAKSSGAAVDFAPQPSAILPLNTVGVATAAEHPNAARLFAHFILSEEANGLLNNPDAGAFGPWDTAELPDYFSVPAPTDFQEVRDQTKDILEALGL